jgi:hypothetical protein
MILNLHCCQEDRQDEKLSLIARAIDELDGRHRLPAGSGRALEQRPGGLANEHGENHQSAAALSLPPGDRLVASGF